MDSVVRWDNGECPTVVLVEDYDDNRFMMRKWLELSGYLVVEVRDGVEAVKAALSHNPDLILMDLGLPKVDGLEATRRIRAISDLSDLPIVALTAYSSEDYSAAAILAGCDTCLTKPLDFDVLEATMRGLLSHLHSTSLATKSPPPP